MTSRTVFMFALAAMLVTVISADLEVPSITSVSGAGGQWPVTGGQLQKWFLDSLKKKEEMLFAKEKELCDLRTKLKQLETIRDITGGVVTSQGDALVTKDNLKDGLTSQGREMTKLRCEQTEREIRGLQTDHEALTNRSLQLQSENLKFKFQINELNANVLHLKENIETCQKELKLYKSANSSESLQFSSKQHELEQDELKQQMFQLTVQVQNLNISMLSQINQKQCTSKSSKITELNMVKFANHYYYFSGQTYNTRTWHEAFSFCKSLGLDLVTIESAEENNFITDHLLQLYGSGWNQHYWLGGNDLSTEGRWVWSSTGQPVTFTAWYSEEPNGGAAHNCLLTHTFASSAHRMWFDYPCTNKIPFICEMEQECN